MNFVKFAEFADAIEMLKKSRHRIHLQQGWKQRGPNDRCVFSADRLALSVLAAQGRQLWYPAPFPLDVQALDRPDTKAVGLELLGTESREPVRGKTHLSFGALFPALL